MIVRIRNTYYQIDDRVDLIRPGMRVIYRVISWYRSPDTTLWSSKDIPYWTTELRRVISHEEYIEKYAYNGTWRLNQMPSYVCTIGAILESSDRYFRITGQWKVKKLKNKCQIKLAQL